MKRALSLRFSRSARTYSKWAIPQRECARILVDFAKPSGEVLDLGCGTGFVSELISGSKNVVGLDLSFNMCMEYRAKFLFAVAGDAESLPFKDNSFDCVISNFTLHWTDMTKSLREMERVSRKRIALSVPVKGSLNLTDFPYPDENTILTMLKDLSPEWFIKEIEIPFRGIELVRFFHYTGSSLNPGRRTLLPRGKLDEIIKSIEEEELKFRVLFLKIDL